MSKVKTIQAVNMLVLRKIGTEDVETMLQLKAAMPKLRDDPGVDQELVTSLEHAIQSL